MELHQPLQTDMPLEVHFHTEARKVKYKIQPFFHHVIHVFLNRKQIFVTP